MIAGAFLMIDIAFLLCGLSLLRSPCHRGKNSRHDLPCRRAGATPRTFWAAESRKSGVAPARFSVFSTVTFACIASLSPTLQRNCWRHRLKNLQKANLKGVVL